MSAVLLAVFGNFSEAERARTELVRDGFPTDRVELTARHEQGRAGLQPAASTQDKFVQYYRTLFDQDDERAFAETLAERVAAGSAATVTVHPRGDIETTRAAQILEDRGAQELVAHDLQNQSFERAASPRSISVVGQLLPDNPLRADCFYCWLFPEVVPGREHRH
jgi:hypothetical protein